MSNAVEWHVVHLMLSDPPARKSTKPRSMLSSGT